MPEMQNRAVGIPEGLDFSDLALSRTSAGDVEFSAAVVEKIAIANGLPPDFFLTQPEDVVSELITLWYAHHIASGGARDPVADDLISEVASEDAAGQNYSYQPGRS